MHAVFVITRIYPLQLHYVYGLYIYQSTTQRHQINCYELIIAMGSKTQILTIFHNISVF